MKMEKYAEFEEMKAQLALLNKKLEKEAIINERLIRRAMKNKAWGIRRKIMVESIACLIMIPYFIWVMPTTGLSMVFCCTVAFFMLLALVYNGYIYKDFSPQEFLLGSLVEARRKTLKLKRLYSSWLKFVGIPFIVLFFSWFVYDMSQVYQGEDLGGHITAGVVGGVIGGIVGTFQYRKIQRTADEILQQIEDISSDGDQG